jgi:hypothetical protein
VPWEILFDIFSSFSKVFVADGEIGLDFGLGQANNPKKLLFGFRVGSKSEKLERQ